MLPKFLKRFYTDIIDHAKDPLTELHTHNDFYHILQDSVRKDEKFALIMMDIVNFGEYNNEKGLRSGDKVLMGVSKILTKMTRNNDHVSRFGGDEFAVIIKNVAKKESTIIAERFQKSLNQYFRDLGSILEVSIGIACFPEDAEDTEEVVRYARFAQFKSKCAQEKEVVSFLGILDVVDSGFDSSDFTTLNSIKTLINIVNTKDKYTYRHSKMVAQYSYLLAKEAGVKKDRLNNLLIAAFLHDIGKIGIDEEILLKPDKLTEREFEKIKRHPEFAAEIIRPISSLANLIPGILHHHERYDGSGYPNGLKKDEISLEGRIIQIADSFDAMTSKRPYQKQLDYMEAWQEIRRCSGTQFDPELVKSFNRVMENAVDDFKTRNSCFGTEAG